MFFWLLDDRHNHEAEHAFRRTECLGRSRGTWGWGLDGSAARRKLAGAAAGSSKSWALRSAKARPLHRRASSVE